MKNINLKLINYKKKLKMLRIISIISYDELIHWLEQIQKNSVIMKLEMHTEQEKYLQQRTKI